MPPRKRDEPPPSVSRLVVPTSGRTDRHKTKPLSIRLPGAERQAVEARSADTGVPVRRIIIDAIRAYLGLAGEKK